MKKRFTKERGENPDEVRQDPYGNILRKDQFGRDTRQIDPFCGWPAGAGARRYTDPAAEQGWAPSADGTVRGLWGRLSGGILDVRTIVGIYLVS